MATTIVPLPGITVTGKLKLLGDKLAKCENLLVVDIAKQKLSGWPSNITLPNATRVLWLQSNNLDGDINEFPKLWKLPPNLESLRLDDNKITGTMNASVWSGVLPIGIRVIDLSLNDVGGELSEAWCELLPQIASFSVTNMKAICGPIPPCLNGLQYAGTSAFFEDEADFAAGTKYGYCDDDRPTCDEKDGCDIFVNPISNSRTHFEFNFTEFKTLRGIRIYTWALEYQLLNGGWDIIGKGYETFWPIEPLPQGFTIVGGGEAPLYKGREFRARLTLPGVELLNGGRYRVKIRALSRAGPPKTKVENSDAFMVDTEPPSMGIVNDGVLCDTDAFQMQSNASSRSSGAALNVITALTTQKLRGCWSGFRDSGSGIVSYRVRLLRRNNIVGQSSSEVCSITCLVSEKVCSGKMEQSPRSLLAEHDAEATCISFELNASKGSMVLEYSNHRDGDEIYFGVSATDGADFPSVEVQSNGYRVRLPTSETAEIVKIAAFAAAPIGFVLFMALVVATVIIRRQAKNMKMAERLRQRQADAEAITTALRELNQTVTANSLSISVPMSFTSNPGQTDMVFVVTDLEGSTPMSASNGKAAKEAQRVHDNVMRRALQQHGGLEIATQGDSFELCFASVSAATKFCLDVQKRLSEHEWTKEVLALPYCEAMYTEDRQLVRVGPRVRMGIHYAKAGTFERKVNDFTMTVVFTGPGYDLTTLVSDAGAGGQILLTEAAVAHLDWSSAGFPLVSSIGAFEPEDANDDNSTPIDLYSVTPGLGSTMYSQEFDTAKLRGMNRIAPGTGLNMSRLSPDDVRAIVCVRFGFTPARLPLQVFSYIMCAVSQIFGGKVLQCITNPETVIVAFEEEKAKSGAAVGCACALQVAMYHSVLRHDVAIGVHYFPGGFAAREAPGEAFVPLRHTTAMPIVNRANTIRALGRVLSSGNRTPRSPHSGSFGAEGSSSTSGGGRTPNSRDNRLSFMEVLSKGSNVVMRIVLDKAAVDQAIHLSRIANLGQTLLSQAAWEGMTTPVLAQARALGTYVLEEEEEEGADGGQLLVEVMPLEFASKTFPQLSTAHHVGKGFYDSPDVEAGVAIVFCRCFADESGAVPPKNLELWSRLCREQVERWDGYWCKEVTGGKFTLSFQNLNQAVACCCNMQIALAETEWPVAMKYAADESSSESSEWRGLRVGMGIAFGTDCYRKALASGRADFFGAIPNTAARVMGQAAAGRVLLMGEVGEWGEWNADLSSATLNAKTADGMRHMELNVIPVGYCDLKGVGPTHLCSAYVDALADRNFPPPKSLIVDGPETARLNRSKSRANNTGAAPRTPWSARSGASTATVASSVSGDHFRVRPLEEIVTTRSGGVVDVGDVELSLEQ
ncbi:adenylate cyclase [Pycnococcus provasolii]